MAFDHIIGKGTRLPVLSQKFTDAAGKLVTFAAMTGNTATFTLVAAPGATPIVNAQPATITLDADGVSADFGYAWQVGDTATSGVFLGKILLTTPAGKTEELPSGTWLWVRIEEVQ